MGLAGLLARFTWKPEVHLPGRAGRLHGHTRNANQHPMSRKSLADSELQTLPNNNL